MRQRGIPLFCGGEEIFERLTFADVAGKTAPSEVHHFFNDVWVVVKIVIQIVGMFAAAHAARR